MTTSITLLWPHPTQEANDEVWAKDQPVRLEAGYLKAGGIYVVKLDHRDGEFFMGIGRANLGKDNATDKESAMHIWWYERCGTSHEWSTTSGAKFKQYGGGADWVHNVLVEESILLKVTDEDLTEGGKANADTSPHLTSGFIQKLRLFAKHNTSDAHCLVASKPTKRGLSPEDATPNDVPSVPKDKQARPNPNPPQPNANGNKRPSSGHEDPVDSSDGEESVDSLLKDPKPSKNTQTKKKTKAIPKPNPNPNPKSKPKSKPKSNPKSNPKPKGKGKGKAGRMSLD